jgi:hypothetical protein
MTSNIRDKLIAKLMALPADRWGVDENFHYSANLTDKLRAEVCRYDDNSEIRIKHLGMRQGPVFTIGQTAYHDNGADVKDISGSRLAEELYTHITLNLIEGNSADSVNKADEDLRKYLKE